MSSTRRSGRRVAAALLSGAGRPEARPARSLSTRAVERIGTRPARSRVATQLPRQAVTPVRPESSGNRTTAGRRAPSIMPATVTRVTSVEAPCGCVSTLASKRPPSHSPLRPGAYSSEFLTVSWPLSDVTGSAMPASASRRSRPMACTVMTRLANSLSGSIMTASPSSGPAAVSRAKTGPSFGPSGLRASRRCTAPASADAGARSTSSDSRQSASSALAPRTRTPAIAPLMSVAMSPGPENSAIRSTLSAVGQPGA